MRIRGSRHWPPYLPRFDQRRHDFVTHHVEDGNEVGQRCGGDFVHRMTARLVLTVTAFNNISTEVSDQLGAQMFDQGFDQRC